MNQNDKDIIASVITKCTPLDNYASLIDWYDNFKKRIRKEIQLQKTGSNESISGKKLSTKRPKRIIRSGGDDGEAIKHDDNERTTNAFRNTGKSK